VTNSPLWSVSATSRISSGIHWAKGGSESQMERFFQWVKDHKAIVGMICVGAFFAPVIIIALLFWIGEFCPLIRTGFNKSDVLSYWGAFLAAIGTISLGALALWQNHVLGVQTKEAQTKLEELEKSRLKPSLNIVWGGNVGTFSNPWFRFYNRGGGSAFDVDVDDLGNNKCPEYEHMPFTRRRIDEISVGKDVNLEYKCSPKSNTKWHIGLLISYSDLTEQQYQLKFELYLSKSTGTKLTIDERIAEVMEL
jgi:hypothetical protein